MARQGGAHLGTRLVDRALFDVRYGVAPHYRERLACYEIALGLDDLRYFAKNGERERYDAMRAILLPLAMTGG